MPGAVWEKSRGTWANREVGLAPARRAAGGLREVGGAFWKPWGEKDWELRTVYRAAALEHPKLEPMIRD